MVLSTLGTLPKSTVSFVSYGVRIGIRVNTPTMLPWLAEYLPPERAPNLSATVDAWYSLMSGGPSPSARGVYHQLYCGQEKLAEAMDLAQVLHVLDSDMRLRIALATREKLFVHAGVVGWQGRAILLPGRSWSGKTTFVAALVKAGAMYYSDEYAVLDPHGLVYPYARPLSLRQPEGRLTRRAVEELGGTAGRQPLSVGLVLHAPYHPGVLWCSWEVSRGQALLTLLDHTIVARSRPHFALPLLARAVSRAVTRAGQRGEAAEAAVALLHQLEGWTGSCPVPEADSH
jgi:hypothetical protein